MKKTILTILAVIVLCLGTAFPAFAQGEVQDFRNSGDSYFVRNSDEFSEMPHTHCMTMGGM